MHHCVRTLCMDSKYCSVASPLSEHSCHSLITHPQPECRYSVTAHSCVSHHSIPHRCLCGIHFPHVGSIPCGNVENLFSCVRSLTPHTVVLARRQRDGFYYLATVKQEEEPGVFLIEFNRPVSERYPTTLQKTEANDMIQYFDALRHCILPGDTVLAPWEPEQVRYGPGIVTLGVETRDPLRTGEDEELTVSFWNGKKKRVPLGVAVWISPSVYKRIMDRLHQPITSGQKLQESIPNSTTYVFTDRFNSVPTNLCPASHLQKHSWHHSHTYPHHLQQHCSCCCYPKHAGCTCCYDPKCQDWWPLTPTATVYVQSRKEQENRDSIHLTTRRKEKSYKNSKSSESEDDKSLDDDDDYDNHSDNDEDSDRETWLSKTTQSTMVDSGVNTDSSLWDKPREDINQRPDWKYWRHSQPEPFYRKPGNTVSKSKSAASQSNSCVSWPDVTGSANQSSLFETIVDSPVRRLTVKDVLAHKDFNPSDAKQAPPVAERLGESEVDKLHKKQFIAEKRREQIMKHREWEEDRAQSADQKYCETQEVHRHKTLQRLKNEDVKVKEQAAKKTQNITAKKAARERNSVRMQTIAAEDKLKEQRRLDHLRSVREKIDQREFDKCAANEQKEIEHMDAQRMKVNKHYKEVADKVFQTETKRKSGNRKVQYIED
ncbi:uncharacterized protein C11orf16 homolog [Pelobates fuscus]|uniref:uncharacterized protein C11orf16 homolog n=1 Tax=Pelobates fuscus TaxID=191477 RepID=UPI002FE49DB2